MKRVAWAYIRAYYNRPQLITVPSESAKQELLAHGITKTIKVISNGIQPEIFDTSKAKEIHKKYSPKGKLLIYIGRIAYEKNIETLLDCFKLIVEKSPTTKLLLIGEGPQMKSTQTKIQQEQLTENIIMLGQIPHKVLIQSSIIAAADIFITASRTENQPMTILEAQANGTVCVGFNVKGIKDLVQDGYNGFLAENNQDFAEKVLRILKNRSLQKEMEKNTLQEIKKHSFQKVIETWEEEYQKVLNKEKKNISTTGL